MLKVKNLSKYYHVKNADKVVALNNISIDFPDNGMFFILGKSGSGKSTLLNILGGLDNPSSGELIINDRSTKDFKEPDFDLYRNTYTGIIFQEYNLLEDLDVKSNVLLAANLQKQNVSEEELEKVLNSVEILELKNRKIQELSGGQKQRVAIARALIKKPEIILADEPTGALDSETGKQIFDILKNISKDKLVIVVTHDKETALNYGDQIIELKDGLIINNVVKNNNENIKNETRELKKSQLPFKNALKIGCSSIKKKPAKLIFTCLLTSFSLGMFGTSLSLAFFDDAYPIETALKDESVGAVAVGKKIAVESLKYNYDKNGNNFRVVDSTAEERYALLSESDVNELNYSGVDFAGIIDFKNPTGSITTLPCFNCEDYSIDDKSIAYYGNYFSFVGFSDCGEEYCDRNFELIEGNYPTSFDEIAISSYEADYLLNCKSNVGDLDFKNYSDIIGQIFKLNSTDDSFGFLTLKVTGIYNVGAIPNKYESLKTNDGRYDDKLKANFAKYISNSFNKIGFVSNDFFTNWSNCFDYDKKLVDPLTIKTRDIESFETKQKVIVQEAYPYEFAKKHEKDFHFYSISNEEIETLELKNDEIMISKNIFNNIVFSKYESLLTDLKAIGDDAEYSNKYFQLRNYSSNAYALFTSNDYLTLHSDYKEELSLCRSSGPSTKLVEYYASLNELMNTWFKELSLRKQAYSSLEEIYYINDGLINAICNQQDAEFLSKIQYLFTNVYEESTSPLDNTEEEWKTLIEFWEKYYDATLGTYNCINTGIQELFNLHKENNLNSKVENIETIKGNVAGLLSRYTSSFDISLKLINKTLPENDLKLIVDTVRMYFKDNSNEISKYSFAPSTVRKPFDSKYSFRFINENMNKEVKIVGYYEENEKTSMIINESLLSEFNITFNNDELYLEENTDYIYSGDGKYSSAFTCSKLSKKDIKNVRINKGNYSYDLIDCVSNSVKETTNSIKSFAIGFSAIGIILAIFSGMLMFNFISTSIAYKKKEIGILRAIGSRPADIFKIFTIETAVVLLISLIVGVGISALGVLFTNILAMNSIGIVITEFSIYIVLLEIALALVVSVLSVSLPIAKTCKKNPIESIRE